MNFEVRVVRVENKPDYFDFTLKNYKQKFVTRFEKSELRHLIEQIDNAI